MANSKWMEREIRENLIRALEENADIIVFDIETTGYSKEYDRVTQLAAKKYQLQDNKIIYKDELDEYICPSVPISPKAEQVSGITNEFIKDKPKENEIFDKIFNFFGTTPNLCAHNSRFDIGFLSNMYKRYGKELKVNIELDTCILAKEVISKYKVQNYRLSTLAKYYGVDKEIDFHNAKHDVIATSSILQIIISEFVEKMKKGEIKKNSDIGRKNAVIISGPNYWKGHNRFSRIYVNTNLGTIFYDILTRKWCEKDEGALDKINMDQLIEEVFERAGVSNEDEFSKFRG